MRGYLTTLVSALLLQSYPFTADCKKICEPPPDSPYDFDLFHKDVEIISLSAEFLYWTVNEGALDYAQRMKQPGWSPTTSYASGTVETAGFDLDPGVRICAGFFNALKLWNVHADYTHLISRGKNRAEKPSAGDEFLTGTWPQITANPLVHAHSKIFFNYNMVEVLVDRVFFPNPHLRLKLAGGAALAWLQQDWKIQYFDGVGGDTTIRNRWFYTAGGLQTGMIADWYWGNNVYMTCGFGGTIYMGSYKNMAKQTTTVQPPGSNADLPVRNSNLKDTRPACSVQFYIGPSYQKAIGCKRIEFFLGYEINGWFNLQEIHRSTFGAPSDAKETWMSTSMLALQGLTTRFGLDF